MTFPKLSLRARNTPPSPIRRLAHLALDSRKRGNHVYHLNIGQPDIESPKEFFEGIKKYQDSVVAYESSSGNEELRRAWSDYMNRTLSLKTNPGEFLITTGASEALIFLFMTCCDPGDEVIIVDPTYANYIGFAAIAGVKLVPVQSTLETNFCLPPSSAIESKISSRTKAILLCSPNNPTGTVYTKSELEILISLCESRGLFFIVDETYREFVYDGVEPLSAFHVAPNNKSIVVVDSLSKRFSLCGARIGCLISKNEEILATALNLAQARLASPTIEQVASAHMLSTISNNFVTDIRNEYELRRNTLFKALSGIPGVVTQKPMGAFYTIARLPVESTDDFASFLLSKFSYEGATTFVAPAGGFYMENGRGRNKIRVAFVLESSEIEKAVEVLSEGLKAYKSNL